MRMAYSEPNCTAAPTPGTRWIGSMTREATMLLSSSALGPPGADTSPMPPRNPAATLAIRIPCWLTSAGRRGCASDTRFWTCTAAMSGLVPCSNVSVMVQEPSEADCEVK